MTGALASAVLLVRKRLVFALLCWAIFLASEGRHGECAVPDAVDGLGRPQVLLHQPEWNRLLKPQAAPQGLETTGSGAPSSIRQRSPSSPPVLANAQHLPRALHSSFCDSVVIVIISLDRCE
eukprot:3164254-Rhodomonas_salina.1